MSYKFLLFPVLFLFFFSCDDDDNIVGSGNLISEMRDASDFTDISASESIRVDVSQGNEFRVELTADDNVIDRVESVIRDGELRFSMAPGSYRSTTVSVQVTMPAIRRIETSTSSVVQISTFDQPADDWTLDLSTSSQLTVLDCTVRNLDFTGSTSSEANCFGLQTVETNLNTSSSASLEISVSERLTGDARTSSEVRYRGDPEVTVSVNTSASVERD